MRSWSLSTPLHGDPQAAWGALVELERWSEWNRLIPRAQGQVAVGQVLAFGIRRVDGSLRDHRPTVQILDRPHHMMLAADFGHRGLLRLEHHLVLERRELVQRWDVTGALTPVLWASLTETFARFQELGEDLQRELTRRQGPAGAPG